MRNVNIRWILLFSLVFGLFEQRATASWEVDSEFKLHLGTKLFDQLVKDFKSSLEQGTQSVPLQDILLSNPAPILISGIHLELGYHFADPIRHDQALAWDIQSQSISAKLFINSVNANQVVQQNFGGTIVNIHLNAECHNIELDLAPNSSYVNASLSAGIASNQVQFSLDAMEADWRSGAWQVKSIECSGATGFSNIVEQQALQALSSLHNFDGPIHAALLNKLSEWSAKATNILLSAHELPTKREDLQIFYEPGTVEEGDQGDILMHGELRFIYPKVNEGKEIVYNFHLNEEVKEVANANESYLYVPEDTIRGLVLGEYYAGNLSYIIPSTRIAGFSKLMQSRFLQFFIWPDLLNFAKSAIFNLRFRLNNPPLFTGVSNGSQANTLQADIELPMDLWSYAPKGVEYIPYVELAASLRGKALMSLTKNGVHLGVSLQKFDLNHRWSGTYVSQYRPNQSIWMSLISSALNAALNTQGMDFPMPTLLVGSQVKLVPSGWDLKGKNLLLRFEDGGR